ncbi:extracellular matrix protein 1 isoform X1 [Arapaima gigas]
MGSFSSWMVALLVLRCTASEGPPSMGQHDVTSDLSEIFGETDLPDQGMLQREVTFDFSSLLEPSESESRWDRPGVSRGIMASLPDGEFIIRDRPVFGPRAFHGHYIPFPPAKPTLGNFADLCRYRESRPHYPPESLPHTGFSYLRRQADAINRVESWYGTCCMENGMLENEPELGVCCAQQAWELTLSQFCSEEFSVKTSHYHCCKQRGRARWTCFETNTPNPTYVPTNKAPIRTLSPAEPGFTWNPSSCHGKRSSRGSEAVPNVRFPPGRPTSANIKNVCWFHKERPRYLSKCMPQTGYSHLVRQGKAVNRFEKGIQKCCKKKTKVLTCADKKWQNAMDWFCREEQSVKTQPNPCCLLSNKEELYKCFDEKAPDPEYRVEMTQKAADSDFTKGQKCNTYE